ncbi:MAG: hypothetical protein ACREFP_10050 [Acetobacteraceae bacterium]
MDFLVNDRHREFLIGMCGRIEAVLQGQTGTEHAVQRLGALRAELDGLCPAVPVDPEPSAESRPAISPALPACEICAAADAALFSFLAEYQYRLGGDYQAQIELATRGGLCGPHTSRFEALAAPREVCTGFAATIERQAARLRAAATRRLPGALAMQAVDAALPTAHACPACAVVRQAATTAVGAAAKRLGREGTAGLANLSAICLPHLRLLTAALDSTELVQAVLLREADLLERLSEDMGHFAMKRDGLLRHLTTKEEASAGERALRVLVGSPTAQMGPEARCPAAGQTGPVPQAQVLDPDRNV